ncbi:hypothetical protein X766_15980 [Mesorhizobium sp. LSJC255A00]|uniref:hypothetical protein n=1 Tax=Mesorhizobium sp. LSJC255A00 TaxID=1287313 RepID=UPI0003CF4CBA|nr:hypothetical protein [Mesorhizobium sp. LSJC255A00]ESX17889.1 hypothetical protein X766_15980 [Mesorhizobium sp. LSJC255A00]
MATVLSASNATATSILSTVQTLAHTAQRTITTAAAGLDMLDTYVEDARVRQADQSKINRHNYRKSLIQESALEQARKEHQLTQEIGSNQVLAKLFNDNHAALEALFAS